ncbi:MAG: hypothetical protein ACTSW7_05795 [Candidatus Thorarchaeota archaeon]
MPNIKRANIKEIASNREKIILENLPALRAFDVHPIMASVTMPNHALTGIKQNIDYINIISENSDSGLRNLFQSVSFDWNQVSYLPVDSNEDGFSRPLAFANRESIQLSEISQYIDDVACFLGLEGRKPAHQLWVLDKFTLLPTKPYKRLSDVFSNKDNTAMLTSQEDLGWIELLESNCTNLLSNITRKFRLQSHESEIQFELVRCSKTKKEWRVTTASRSSTNTCTIPSSEFSYNLLLRLSIMDQQENSVEWHLGLLKKIIGGISLIKDK